MSILAFELLLKSSLVICEDGFGHGLYQDPGLVRDLIRA